MKYKALMLDLDGTTIPNRPDGMPSQRVITAIAKAKAKLQVCAATGRHISYIDPILDALQLSGPTILLHGALIIDGMTRKFLYEKPLLTNDLHQIIDYLVKNNIRFIVDDREKIFENNKGYNPHQVLAVYCMDLNTITAEALMSNLSHIPTIAMYKDLSWDHGSINVNISHLEATKQHGIFEVAKRLGIETHKIIGVGDGYNDFPLLMACGLKVAMGNAVDDLKAIADYIAPTVEEDGVVDVIEKFVLQ